MPLVHIEVAPLRVGDYDVGGNPRRVFERKTGSDFLGSLAQGRLFAQLTALRKSRFAPVLLLEGDPLRVSHSQMRPESIRGALAYITAILRVPILPSSGPTESAHLVYAAARQCQVGHAAHGPAAGRRGASLSERQMQIVLSLPGIGPVTARAVCARFRSLHELLSAARAAGHRGDVGIGPALLVADLASDDVAEALEVVLERLAATHTELVSTLPYDVEDERARHLKTMLVGAKLDVVGDKLRAELLLKHGMSAIDDFQNAIFGDGGPAVAALLS